MIIKKKKINCIFINVHFIELFKVNHYKLFLTYNQKVQSKL